MRVAHEGYENKNKQKASKSWFYWALSRCRCDVGLALVAARCVLGVHECRPMSHVTCFTALLRHWWVPIKIITKFCQNRNNVIMNGIVECVGVPRTYLTIRTGTFIMWTSQRTVSLGCAPSKWWITDTAHDTDTHTHTLARRKSVRESMAHSIPHRIILNVINVCVGNKNKLICDRFFPRPSPPPWR